MALSRRIRWLAFLASKRRTPCAARREFDDPGAHTCSPNRVDYRHFGSRLCNIRTEVCRQPSIFGDVTDRDILPEMSQLSFDHLLQLSFAFHARRKTGEVLRILDRGAAINRTFEVRAHSADLGHAYRLTFLVKTLVFNILPTFFDIAIALVFFVFYFEWTLAVVIFLVMAAYGEFRTSCELSNQHILIDLALVAASVVLTRWRTKLRRQMNDRDVIIRGIHTDCLLNYETVKYFNGEQHEGERYRDAIRQYQNLEHKVMGKASLTAVMFSTLTFSTSSIPQLAQPRPELHHRE